MSSTLTSPATGRQATPQERIAVLPRISLEDINDAAALQTRVDRKYILDRPQLSLLLSNLEDRLAALEVDGQRSFGYESVYFDTPDLECFRSAAHKRRKRFKVRTRSYVDSRTTMLEVKTKGQRSATVKTRQPHPFGSRAELDGSARRFIEQQVCRPGLAETLCPVLTTRYDRITVVDLDDVARITIDVGLRCISSTGVTTGLDDAFVVETKSAGPPSAADRELWAEGIRPSRISKFGTGMAALHPSLPSNKWHQTLNRHFR